MTIHTLDHMSEAEGPLLRAMFEARKRVFVDLLNRAPPFARRPPPGAGIADAKGGRTLSCAERDAPRGDPPAAADAD